MKIVIPGGTGQVGTLLARAFAADGHEVVVLSRTPTPAPWRVVHWDAETVGDWAGELDGADAVINLAGRSVNCRYSAANRKLILDSRVNSTRAVGQAIARAARPPRVWVQSSTATIYAHRFDAPNDEAPSFTYALTIDFDSVGEPRPWRPSVFVAMRRKSRASRKSSTNGNGTKGVALAPTASTRTSRTTSAPVAAVLGGRNSFTLRVSRTTLSPRRDGDSAGGYAPFDAAHPPAALVAARRRDGERGARDDRRVQPTLRRGGRRSARRRHHERCRHRGG